MLQFRNVSKKFGALAAISDLNVDFKPGIITSVIGPNGAGKSTAINLASGAYPLSGGAIFLDGRDITGLPPYKLAQSGVSRTFQNLRLFEDMTLIEHIEVCELTRTFRQVPLEVFWPPAARRMAVEREKRAMAVLEKFDLAGIGHVRARDLPYGHRKLLEIARAIAVRPRVLFLDEPAAGLNFKETRALGERLLALRSPDLIIVLIEHDMDMVMRLSDEIYVLHQGRLLAHGTPDQIKGNTDVQTAYLGSPNDHQALQAAARARESRVRIRTGEGVTWH